MNKRIISALLTIVLVLSSTTPIMAAQETSTKTSEELKIFAKNKYSVYTITPDSTPYNNYAVNSSNYNKYTKHYFLMSSYLQQMEKEGGGTLILEKGTYTITNSLCVPSNVTIQLNDGVIIKKGNETGINSFPAAKSIFHLIRYSKSKIDSAVAGHKGEKNITFIGKGTAIIDLDYIEGAMGIVAGHNKKVTIENIHFKNVNAGHFMDIAAVKNIKIINNKFTDSKASAKFNKEALNIDTPDALTNGFKVSWSATDKVPNKNVIIEGNYFENLDRAIGTHKYSQNRDKNGEYTINMYHTKISIKNNTFINMRDQAIRIMNWKDTVIEGNHIENTNTEATPTEKMKLGSIAVNGAVNLTIINNVFQNLSRAVYIFDGKNTDSGSEYSPISSKLTNQNMFDLAKNTIIDVTADSALVDGQNIPFE